MTNVTGKYNNYFIIDSCNITIPNKHIEIVYLKPAQGLNHKTISLSVYIDYNKMKISKHTDLIYDEEECIEDRLEKYPLDLLVILEMIKDVKIKSKYQIDFFTKLFEFMASQSRNEELR